MKGRRIIYLFLLMHFVIVLTSCAFITKSTTKKQIVTTLYPEYDMITKIIGTNEETKGLFDVTLIIPLGQDAHTYDPSISDLLTIKSADIFIYTGDEMETWVKDLEFSEKTKVINLSLDERIVLHKASEEDAPLTHEKEENEDHAHEHNHVHEYDPHYWVYPIYSIYMAEQIRDALIEATPAPNGDYSKHTVLSSNAKRYIDELYKIDEEIKETVALAKKTTGLNTMYFGAPFSFYYWHIFYGLDYKLTYSTCSTESEPPLEVLVDMIQEMKEKKIDVIFAKELVNQEACEMIRFHTNAKICVMHSGHNISVSDFNNPEMSFLSILQNDVENLKQMLQVDKLILNNEGGIKE